MRKNIVILLFLFLLLPFGVRAQEQPEPQVRQVDYVMPFPGMLPDNPLYPLKVIRDKIYDFLLSDVVKKAEFKLLMADKRMVMSQKLLEKGRPELAETTMSKASKYYEEAVMTYYQAEKNGRDVKILGNRLIDASQKYQEMVDSFPSVDSATIKGGFDGSMQRVIKYRDELLQSQGSLQN